MNTNDCIKKAEENSDIPIRQFPLKLKLFQSLGLDQFLINRFVKSYSKVPYSFPRKNLKFICNSNSHIPFIYFPKLFPDCSTILIYSHGSGSNLEHVYGIAERLSKLYDIAVVTYDYSGCGQSQMAKGDMGSDLRLVLSWVLKQGYIMSNIILCGFSLGSYPTLSIIEQIPKIIVGGIAGLISFVQGEVARYKNDPFDNIKNCLKISNTHILIIHSRNDKKVALQHSQLLHKALIWNRKKTQIDKVTYIQLEGLQHNQIMNFLTCQPDLNLTNFIQKTRQSKNISIDSLQLCRKLLALQFEVK